MIPHPQRSTLFPYTTLFRSDGDSLGIARKGIEDIVVARLLRGHLGIHARLDGVEGDGGGVVMVDAGLGFLAEGAEGVGDRKSTRLNSSHGYISYAVFCLKKK